MNKKIKVLIVEDDRSLLDLYDIAIPEKIFEKRLANNGSSALDIYREWQPHMIVLDIMLPDRSGFTILEEIRLKLDDKSTAIVMSTSLDRKSDIEKCREMDIQGYIVKPFDHKTIAGELIEFFSASNPQLAEKARIMLKTK